MRRGVLSSGFLISILVALLCLRLDSMAHQTPAQNSSVVTFEEVSSKASAITVGTREGEGVTQNTATAAQKK